jgi:AcrR family transcriptional regulator
LKILDAATEIAAERGYEGTSIGLVRDRSGLPASSIYWHFKDKDTLIAAVIEHSFQTWLSHATGWAPPHSGEPLERRLEALLSGIATSLRESTDFLRLGLMLALERRSEEPAARRMFISVRREALRRTESSYANLFPELGARAVRELASLSMAMADGVFIAAEMGDEQFESLVEPPMLAAAMLGASQYLIGRDAPVQL